MYIPFWTKLNNEGKSKTDRDFLRKPKKARQFICWNKYILDYYMLSCFKYTAKLENWTKIAIGLYSLLGSNTKHFSMKKKSQLLSYLKSSWAFINATRSLTAWMKSSWPAISLVTTENCCQLYLAKIDNMAATWCSKLGANCNCNLACDCKETENKLFLQLNTVTWKMPSKVMNCSRKIIVNFSPKSHKLLVILITNSLASVERKSLLPLLIEKILEIFMTSKDKSRKLEVWRFTKNIK